MMARVEVSPNASSLSRFVNVTGNVEIFKQDSSEFHPARDIKAAKVFVPGSSFPARNTIRSFGTVAITRRIINKSAGRLTRTAVMPGTRIGRDTGEPLVTRVVGSVNLPCRIEFEVGESHNASLGGWSGGHGAPQAKSRTSTTLTRSNRQRRTTLRRRRLDNRTELRSPI